MTNLLSLYNPYYNEHVIEEHLELLKSNNVVAFGKVRSKLRDYEHPNQLLLDDIYKNTARDEPIQLFLTDYNSIYVANVISIKESVKLVKVPKYYDDLDVEYWFIFDDLRLIVHNDFELIRDKILANFLATNFNNRTYTIYGNPYVYPMQVSMKEDVNYFDKDDEAFKFYTNIFKSEAQLQMKQHLMDFNFGKKQFYSLAPNSQNNIIGAEIEYMENRDNILYDFSSVIVKYSKAVELELYRFMSKVFLYLIEQDNELGSFSYSVQGRDYSLKGIDTHKPNLGTYAYLIKSYEIKDALNTQLEDRALKHFILVDVPSFIRTMQNVRNESVHGDTTALKECNKIRAEVMGIGKRGIIGAFTSNTLLIS